MKEILILLFTIANIYYYFNDGSIFNGIVAMIMIVVLVWISKENNKERK